MKRRSFIKSTAASAAATPFVVGGLKARATTSLAMLAQMPPESDRVLVVIQLFGGNDGLNTLIPAQDSNYFAVRPGLAIPPDMAWNGLGDIYLHPALATGAHGGIATMLEVGNLAIVQGVGYDNPNLSHFRSTDIWLSGINSSNPNVRLDTGWIGRFLEHRYPDFPASLPDDPLAIQLGGFSLLLRGSNGKKMGIEVTDPEIQQGVTAQIDALDDDAAGTPYAEEFSFIADIAGRSNVYAERVRNAYDSGLAQLQGEYEEDGFNQQMKAVAAMIAGGLDTKVYVVSMGGFDTHSNQQRIDGDVVYGSHPLLLGRLASAVGEFQYDMIRLGQGDRVVGMTLSEFGRRARENGSYGTDHGAASVQFVFGTQVNSAVFGEAPDLANLNANGDLRAQIDYRSIYTEILTDWFDMPLDDARDVLDDDTLLPIDVLKRQSTSVGSRRQIAGGVAISGFRPNPFHSESQLSFSLDHQTRVRVEIRSMNGGGRTLLLDRTLDAGHHETPFGGDLPAGNYLLTVHTANGAASDIVTKIR